MNHLILMSILWWTGALLAGSIAYPVFAGRFGHNLKSEFATMGVIVGFVAVGVTITAWLGLA